MKRTILDRYFDWVRLNFRVKDVYPDTVKFLEAIT